MLQKPFNQHQFEFGTTTTITGTYYNSPVPMIIADKGTLADSLSHDVMLVGFGKFGAKGVIANIEQEKLEVRECDESRVPFLVA